MPKKIDKLVIGFVFDDSLDKSDGVQQYILSLGSWLTSQGHEVHYLVGSTKRSDIQNIHSLSRNINVRFNGNRMSVPLPTSKNKIRSVLKNNNFNVLHVQVPYSPLLAKRIIQQADNKTAVIGTFHILSESKTVKFATLILGLQLKKSLERFDKMLSVSEPAKTFAIKTFKIESTVLPNAITYSKFHYAEAHKLSNAEINILFLGRLVPRKGCLLLLKAFAQIISDPDLPLVHLTICGKGPLESHLKDYAREHKIEKHITFKGYISEADKPSYYAGADISVFPSTGGESFGIVLLEAMACGKAAVLAGDNLGYSSVMEERKNLLFDPRDTQALSKLLESFIKDKSLRDAAKSWGEQHSKSFDTSVVGANLITIYTQALRKRTHQ